MLIAAALLAPGAAPAQQPPQPPPPAKLPLPKAHPPPQGIITQGPAKTITEELIPCAVTRPGMNLRKNPVGEITAKDGTKFTVPTANNFETAPKLPDLYNECAGVTPKDMSALDLNKVPVVEVDKDGEVVTGFMVADNYFELYINGKLIGVDATPFTPFNSHAVRFRVKRPYTIAVLGQDWEDKLGLGMEVFQGNTWHFGDGGFVAKFSDGTAIGPGPDRRAHGDHRRRRRLDRRNRRCGRRSRRPGRDVPRAAGEKRGAAAARNVGVAAASGDYLAFLDATIFGRPRAPPCLAARSRRKAGAPSRSAMWSISSPRRSHPNGEAPWPHPRRRRASPISPAGFLCRADLAVGVFDETLVLGEFIDWFGRARRAAFAEIVVPDIVLRRGIHGENMSLRQRAAARDYLEVARRALARKRDWTSKP